MSTPDNELTTALHAAAHDPAARPAFVALLRNATVYAICDDPETAEGEQQLMSGSSLKIAVVTNREGLPHLPLFSQLEFLRQFNPGGTRYVELPARALFAMSRGSHFVLNPGRPISKVFTAEEALELSSDTVPSAPTEAPVESLRVGIPAVAPTTLLENLSALFRTWPIVSAAYCVLVARGAMENMPQLLIALEVSGIGFAELQPQIATFMQHAHPELGTIDLQAIVRGAGELDDFIVTSVPPFFEISRN